MDALRASPLFRRVLAGVVGVFALVAAALSIGSAWQLNRSLRAEFLSKATAIATSIASTAVELLVNRDHATLQATIDQFLEIRGVAYVLVVDERGDIVSHTFVPFVPDALRPLVAARHAGPEDAVTVSELEVPGSDPYLDVAAPILEGVAGTAHVGMDTGVIAADVRTAVAQQQAGLLVVFLASLVLAYLFVRRTSRPLQALTAHVRRISGEGFRHYAPDPQVERIAAKSRDEVGDLSRAFLVMASTIGRNIEDLERAKDELAAYSVSLEHRVEERTAELSEKNRALESALARLKEAQEQIVAQEKLASLGALTAGIAHEIRNPLNFITNFAQMSGELTAELAESIGKLVPADRAGELTGVLDMIKANVAKIDEHGKRADSIVRHMLQHSRGRKGEPTEVAVNRIVREYVGLAYHGMRGQDPSFNAKIEADYDPAAGTIQAVAQDFCRAILNILTNACFALHEKKQQAGEGFTPVLTVSTRSLGDRVEIRIRDNGPGILPEVREKMFEPFFTTKPAGAGTGLGLSITFDIIVAHGGTIQVESEPGQYAEFIVTLPRGGPGAAASPA